MRSHDREQVSLHLVKSCAHRMNQGRDKRCTLPMEVEVGESLCNLLDPRYHSNLPKDVKRSEDDLLIHLDFDIFLELDILFDFNNRDILHIADTLDREC